MNYSIIPGEGLGNLKFGSIVEQIEEMLGTPDEIEKDDDILFPSVIWYYPEQELTLFLQDDKIPILVSIESSHPDTTLFNQKIFGMSEKKIIALLIGNGIAETETENEEWGERRVSAEDLMLDFYFENDRLITVNWSMITEDDEE